MFDPRLYRTALLLVLLAVLAAAFSLDVRPRPYATAKAPDQFNGQQAQIYLNQMATRYPSRLPGDSDDAQAAEYVARTLKSQLDVEPRRDTFEADTIQGRRELVNVIASRPGGDGPGIVVVAHRDAAKPGARAELSGTAAMLEIARVVGDGRLNRSITFISTSGGSGGLAGAIRAAKEQAAENPVAVLVLGDMAGRQRGPVLVPWSNAKGRTPLRLTRTVEAALRQETGRDPGSSHGLTQLARLAAPMTIGEQGAFARLGLPSLLIQVSGERGPSAGDRISVDRLQLYGRAALRSIFALDDNPAEPETPAALLIIQRKVLPYWAVRVLIGSLLLVPLLVAIDGYARQRRRERTSPWALWTISWTIPLAMGCLFMLSIAKVGLLKVAPQGPIGGEALSLDGSAAAGIIGLICVLILGFMIVRPAVLGVVAPETISEPPSAPGAGMAVVLLTCVVALVAWAVNAFAGALLVPAVHIWLLALSPQVRLPRIGAVALAALGLAPLLLVAIVDATAFGWSPGETLWSSALLVAGGHLSFPLWTLSCTVAACCIAALVVAYRLEREEGDGETQITVRGPVTYAGPGSLGGTEPARR
jgi:hypothetical protein